MITNILIKAQSTLVRSLLKKTSEGELAKVMKKSSKFKFTKKHYLRRKHKLKRIWTNSQTVLILTHKKRNKYNLK